MKVWFDLCHPPHVLFFAPQIRELERRRHRILVTVRDRFQVTDLCGKEGLPFTSIGTDYGRHAATKAAGFAIRVGQLVSFARRTAPDLAVSQGSSYQVLAARMLGIPSAFMTDYEHVFLHVARLFASRLFFPESIPDPVLEEKGLPLSRVVKYPGLKEDVYIPEFRPDPGLRRRLGIPEDRVVVTVRPPSFGAHYRNPESEALFYEAMERLLGRPDTVVLLFPRSRTDRDAFSARFSGRGSLIMPEETVNALQWIWMSDAVVGGGGTMNREAASLGVPVYTLFRGRTGAVDRKLSEQGRLFFLETRDDVRRMDIQPRTRSKGGKGRIADGDASLKNFLVDKILEMKE
jgi:hypothetical protein